MRRIFIVSAKRNGINRFGARKYTRVPSDTEKGKYYDIAKVRVRNTRNYKYVCTCPDHMYRQITCKHIVQFKHDERFCINAKKNKSNGKGAKIIWKVTIK